jgi:hypothetical protein
MSWPETAFCFKPGASHVPLCTKYFVATLALNLTWYGDLGVEDLDDGVREVDDGQAQEVAVAVLGPIFKNTFGRKLPRKFKLG